jgi:hypothetical protein
MHDNTDTDEQYTTDESDTTGDAPPIRDGLSVPMQPRHGPRPGHLT